ncbi:alpha/beta fold hydrolase [Nocardioides sp.]|uniref:alpha/beta fold hydrolase n=1 Tax=Nocardioides sp. TaxID=35761 RepID=UPI0027232ACC|nr:alpha/beta hydrolase [Nocardioides sp.]MDO9457964.1 alpha/beta hydrolase [Nocardioides sp.]
MSSHGIDLPAGRVHYREVGPADGRAVVLVHGFLVDSSLWGDVPDRLAEQGFRCLVPTWPLGAHATAMGADADLSPRGVARIVLTFLAALDLDDVVLVGSDTGGAVCQLLLDTDASRVGRLVLTDCDAFDTFPPFPFDLLFRLARHPRAARVALQSMRVGRLRTSRLGFGWLVRRRLTAAETLPWVTPYLSDAGVRRDVARFARGWSRDDLVAVAPSLAAFERPVLLVWARRDPFFKLALAERLAATFPDARLVVVDDALTFVSLDQPERLVAEIVGAAS